MVDFCTQNTIFKSLQSYLNVISTTLTDFSIGSILNSLFYAVSNGIADLYATAQTIYINSFLAYENIQFTNFLNFINNYIGSYLNYINSITFNNMAFNSDEISNNYNLYKNNCTYCISSSYQNFLTDYSRKYKFFFFYI